MTDINKQIEEEAIKYANYTYGCDDDSKGILYNETLKDFKAGAEYILHASRWRKVRDELPEEGEVVVVRIVFLSNRECNIQKGFMYDIAIYHPRDKEFYSRASIAPSMYEICDPVIEWKPIY